MAKADLNLHIGTTYDGEGFKKLNNALKTSSKSVKQTSSMVNQVVNGLGNLDSKAGKVVGTIGNLIGSFAAMGVAGLVIGGITTAFQLITNKINESKEAVKQMGEAIKNRLLAAMGDTEAKATVMVQKFQKMADAIKNASATSENVADHDAQDRVNMVRRRHIDGRKGMKDDHAITQDKAKEQYEIGAIREERILEKAKAKWKMTFELLEAKRKEQIESADLLEEAQKREQKVIEKSQKYLQEKKRLEDGRELMDQMAKERPAQAWKWNKESAKFSVALEKHDKDNSADVDRLKKASDLVTKAQERNKKATEDVARLNAELGIAKMEEESASLQYSTNMKSLAETLQEQKTAVQKAIAAEKKQAEEEKKRNQKEAERKSKEAKKEMEKKEDDANRLKIRDIEKQTERKLKELNPALEKMKQAAESWSRAAKDAEDKDFNQWKRDKKKQQEEDDKRVNKKAKNIRNAEDRQKQIGERIFDRNGKIRRSANKNDIAEWKRLNEYIQLQPQNDERLREAAQREQDKIGSRIFDKDGKLRKSANKKDVEKWKDLQKNFVKPDNPVERMKQAEKERDQFVKQQADDIKVIKEKLDKVGL